MGALRLRGGINYRCVSFIHFTLSSILSDDTSPQWLPCPPCHGLHLGLWFYKIRLLHCSWAPFSFALQIVAKLLWAPLFCLLDATIELHPMNEIFCNDFFIEKWKRFSYVIKAYLIHDFHFVYVVEGFIHIKL